MATKAAGNFDNMIFACSFKELCLAHTGKTVTTSIIYWSCSALISSICGTSTSPDATTFHIKLWFIYHN